MIEETEELYQSPTRIEHFLKFSVRLFHLESTEKEKLGYASIKESCDYLPKQKFV